MNESWIELSGDLIFLRRSSILPGRTTLLFVHGLGDSGLAFAEVFEDERFGEFNLLVPDLAGFGRSSGVSDYSLDGHVRRLSGLVDTLARRERVEINEVVGVGHSMGGDLLTLLCASEKKDLIRKFVNVEGNLTQADLFISCQASGADDRGEFVPWFNETFLPKVYNEWGVEYESCRRYYASLRFARLEAFRVAARGLCERNSSLEGEYKSEIGAAYSKLSIPKVFCCGNRSISPATLGFLEKKELEYKLFEDAFHWPMIDRYSEFYSFLLDFICPQGDSRQCAQASLRMS